MVKRYSIKREDYKQILFFLSFITALCTSASKSHAQQKEFKIDTVEMEVIISIYTDAELKDSKHTDVNQKFVIEPKSKGFDITRLLKKNYKPDFNGVFIINDDQLVQYGIVMKKARGFKTTKNPIRTNRPSKFKQVPDGVQGAKYFYGLTVKARWLKYEIKNFDPIEMAQKKLYEKNTGRHDGRFNFYVIDKAKHVRTIYE
jgi:hypothetical protein